MLLVAYLESLLNRSGVRRDANFITRHFKVEATSVPIQNTTPVKINDGNC
jgi:hypothetical protein